MPGVWKKKMWEWGSPIVKRACNVAVANARKGADASVKVGKVMMQPLKKQYDERWPKIKAFLEDQGFNVPPDDCMPNPPGYRPKRLYPKGLPLRDHKKAWAGAWKMYKQSWIDDLYRNKDDTESKKKEISDSLNELGQSLNLKKQSKEEIMGAFNELKSAVTGDRKTTDRKQAIKNLQETAKKQVELYRETVQSFMQGYREVIEMHEAEERKLQDQQEAQTVRGEPGVAHQATHAQMPSQQSQQQHQDLHRSASFQSVVDQMSSATASPIHTAQESAGTRQSEAPHSENSSAVDPSNQRLANNAGGNSAQ